MLPAGSIVCALYHKLYTQSRTPDDGRNYRPKHVELIETVNKIIIVASSWLFILYYAIQMSISLKPLLEYRTHSKISRAPCLIFSSQFVTYLS